MRSDCFSPSQAVVAELAVVVEQEYLSGMVVILLDYCGSGLVEQTPPFNHMWGQCWMRLLTMVSLRFNIRVICKHVPGTINVIADGPSRCVQETSERLLQSGFMQR
jgi:hypothetical protein